MLRVFLYDSEATERNSYLLQSPLWGIDCIYYLHKSQVCRQLFRIELTIRKTFKYSTSFNQNMLYPGYGLTNRADFRIILGSLGLLIISDLKIFKSSSCNNDHQVIIILPTETLKTFFTSKWVVLLPEKLIDTLETFFWCLDILDT